MTVRPRYLPSEGFARDAWLEIDLAAIEHNYMLIRNCIGAGVKVMSVIKSDAYGHGAAAVSTLLEALGSDYFGVASVDEGVQLRNAGIVKPVLVLSPAPSWAIEKALQYKLQITISSLAQWHELESLLAGRGHHPEPTVQLKLNTGMNRGGVNVNSSEASELFTKISEHRLVNFAGVYSHLASPKDPKLAGVQLQALIDFRRRHDEANLIWHIGASDALMNPEFQLDMVRPGLTLFGLGANPTQLAWRPALSLYARLTHIVNVEKGSGVGYGHTWLAQSDSSVGLLPLGYADGVFRRLSNKIFARYGDSNIPQVGTISMDQLSIDISRSASPPKLGDKLQLLGSQGGEAYTVANWAKLAETIEYEIVCALRARLPRVYIRS